MRLILIGGTICLTWKGREEHWNGYFCVFTETQTHVILVAISFIVKSLIVKHFAFFSTSATPSSCSKRCLKERTVRKRLIDIPAFLYWATHCWVTTVVSRYAKLCASKLLSNSTSLIFHALIKRTVDQKKRTKEGRNEGSTVSSEQRMRGVILFDFVLTKYLDHILRVYRIQWAISLHLTASAIVEQTSLCHDTSTETYEEAH